MAEQKNTKPKDENLPESPYETRDVDFKKLMISGFGLVGLILAMLLGAWLISDVFIHHSDNPGVPAHIITTTIPHFPEPALQPNPVLDLKHMHEHEDSVLTSYAWTDRKAGLVRVPIDTAMTLLLRQGLPVVSGQQMVSERIRHAR